MSTFAQIAANRANSQLSTGPKTEIGKAAAARNNFCHGLAPSSAFWVLPSECQSDFDNLLASFREEHQPATLTEEALVQAMAEHHWLRHRALKLEEACFDFTTGQIIDAQKLALYLRYQTVHERGFHKSLNELLKLRADRRKAEIGFERQEHARAEQTRKQEKHQMAKERHKSPVLSPDSRLLTPLTNQEETFSLPASMAYVENHARS